MADSNDSNSHNLGEAEITELLGMEAQVEFEAPRLTTRLYLPEGFGEQGRDTEGLD